MSDLYSDILAMPDGGRALASARLRGNIRDAIWSALRACGLTQADLARKLRIRKSAVNRVFNGDGNVQVDTIAEYLFEMGYELRIDAEPFGTQRDEIEYQLEHQRADMGYAISAYMSLPAHRHEAAWVTGGRPQLVAEQALALS